jgi:predicted dehydrogenase
MISVGLVSTSWWSEVAYIQALQDHPHGRITAICGRDAGRTRERADKWNIPHVYTDYNTMMDSGEVQAVIVATPNVSHYPITMKALEAGLHVLCEKPLAMNYAETKAMADLAEAKGIKTLIPFTWSFMPAARYLKELIDRDYLGQPYDLNMRWYAGYARTTDYIWRVDKGQAGSGVLGDLGSHFIHLAYWYFGEIAAISCHLGYMGQRPALDPSGQPYEPADDLAFLTLQFKNGAQGVIHLSYMANEEAPGAGHHMEFHGSDGALYHRFDFANVQQVSGSKVGDAALRELPIPDHIWAGASGENFWATITDVVHKQDYMARGWLTNIAENKLIKPDFQDGAYVQRVIDAALKSHAERRWVDVESIV